MNDTLPPPERDPKIQAVLEREAHNDAYQAALALSDVLFTRHGIRPTASNVRQLLQRGSNGTIQNAVNVFWQRLQLRTRTALPSIPVPEEVAESFGQIWRAALVAAEGQWNSDREAWRQQLADAETAKQHAEQAAQAAADQEQQLRDRLQHVLQLQQSCDEARLRAEREADEWRAQVEQLREEMRRVQQQADALVHEAQDNAKISLERMGLEYEGLRHLLLQETAREREQMAAQQQQAQRMFDQEREAFAKQLRQSETIQNELRAALLDAQQNMASLRAEIAVLQQQAASDKQEHARLNQSVERLMTVLERLSGSPQESSPTLSPTLLEGMRVMMNKTYASISAENTAVVLSDWKLESITCFQDEYGLEADAQGYFEHVLSRWDRIGFPVETR